MENMIKQMRVKFSGLDKEIHKGEASNNVRDQLKSASQKTRSFKEDYSRRVDEKWYRPGGQSSGELEYDNDSDYMASDEFKTAIAAAAFAIDSVEERRCSTGTGRRRIRGGGDGGRRNLSKHMKIKKQEEDAAVSMKTRKVSERIISPSNTKMKKIKDDDDDDTLLPISTTPTTLLSKKFSELQENSPAAKTEPTNQQPMFQLATDDEERRPSTLIKPNDIKAEVFEKTQMERIKQRQEKLNSKILEWEKEKKAKAKKKLSRNNKDGVSEKKRVGALKNYRSEMEMIDEIAEGARSQAQEKHNKEVIKVKKKADTIRLTGEFPTNKCLCF